MKILNKIKEKIAYEKGSYRLSDKELKLIRREHPELFLRKNKK